jgi:hypothetical protein
MTAFDCGRRLDIYGTKGVLKSAFVNDAENFGAGAISGITVTVHGSNEQKAYDIKPAYEDYDPHGGGDFGIIDNLYDKMTNDEPETILSSAVHSHIVSFAAEEAMVTGKVVDISKFEAEHKK